ERRHRDIEDREDEVGAAQRSLARQERFELELAMPAVDRARRDDRDEEYRLLDRGLDLRFPQPARRDRLVVLPQPEILAGAAELRAQFVLDGFPQRRQPAPVGLVIVPRIAEEADELRKIRKR